jgi:hypothetical protein
MSTITRSVAATDKVRGALQDRLEGYDWWDVATRNGYANPQNAHRAVRRYLARHPSPEIEDVRQESELQLLKLIRIQWDTITRPHFKFNELGEMVLNPDGKPVLDPVPAYLAAKELRALIETRMRLHGITGGAGSRLTAREMEQSEQISEDILKTVKEFEAHHLANAATPDPMYVAARLPDGYPELLLPKVGDEHDSPPVWERLLYQWLDRHFAALQEAAGA